MQTNRLSPIEGIPLERDLLIICGNALLPFLSDGSLPGLPYNKDNLHATITAWLLLYAVNCDEESSFEFYLLCKFHFAHSHMADALLELIDSLASPSSPPSVSPPPPTPPKPKGLNMPARKSSTQFANIDYVALLQRSSETTLEDSERQNLYMYLLALTNEALNEIQAKSRPVISISNPNVKQYYDLKVSDYGMVFDHKKTPMQTRQVEVMPMHCKGGPLSARYQIFTPPENSDLFLLEISPKKGKVTSGKPLTLEFNLTFRNDNPGKTVINLVAELLVEGGYRHFFRIQVCLILTIESKRIGIETISFGEKDHPSIRYYDWRDKISRTKRFGQNEDNAGVRKRIGYPRTVSN